DAPFRAARTADRTIGVEVQPRHSPVRRGLVRNAWSDDLVPVGADAGVPPVACAGDVGRRTEQGDPRGVQVLAEILVPGFVAGTIDGSGPDQVERQPRLVLQVQKPAV